MSKPPRSVFHRGIGFPGIDGPAHRLAEPLVFAPLRVRSIVSDWLGPQPYGVHHPLLADQGRSPRLLGLFATGNPCPPVKDRTGRDCLGLRLLQGFGSSPSLAARITDSHKPLVRLTDARQCTLEPRTSHRLRKGCKSSSHLSFLPLLAFLGDMEMRRPLCEPNHPCRRRPSAS